MHCRHRSEEWLLQEKPVFPVRKMWVLRLKTDAVLTDQSTWVLTELRRFSKNINIIPDVGIFYIPESARYSKNYTGVLWKCCCCSSPCTTHWTRSHQKRFDRRQECQQSSARRLTLREHGGGDAGVLFLHICNQISNAHQHWLEEEPTLLLPRGQRDLQDQTAIPVLQGSICSTALKVLNKCYWS